MRRIAEQLATVDRRLSRTVDALSFGSPVKVTYNPLRYAWSGHEEYLRRYGAWRREVLLVGMNPGPWGMAQTGVPFGEVGYVRDWLKIDRPVGKPRNEHPKRPVEGMACERSEISGRRLWSWAEEHFGSPERFFKRFFIYNYCPLLFLEGSGRNLTPDRLPAAGRKRLFAACDGALAEVVAILQPRWVVGIGNFAAERARRALAGRDVEIGRALHPSPASPAANRGWAERFEAQLAALGVLRHAGG